jgi:hypothetical protein
LRSSAGTVFTLAGSWRPRGLRCDFGGSIEQ